MSGVEHHNVPSTRPSSFMYTFFCIIDRVPSLGSGYATLRQQMLDKRLAAREYTREHGDDIPEVRDWVWPGARHARSAASIEATLATGGDNE